MWYLLIGIPVMLISWTIVFASSKTRKEIKDFLNDDYNPPTAILAILAGLISALMILAWPVMFPVTIFYVILNKIKNS